MGDVVGYIDGIGKGQISGWAYTGQEAEMLEIRIDGKTVGRVAAVLRRGDLVEHRIGNGSHGFLWPIPAHLSFTRNSTVSAVVEDGRPLENSGRTIESLLRDRSILFDESGAVVRPAAQGEEDSSHLTCSVCGGNSFREHKVLRARLIADWQLSEEEVAYIDRQQGLACIACGANLRAVALAKAIRKAMSTELSVLSAVESGDFGDWHVLDLNGALGLSRVLSKLPHYVRADFPEYDMMHLPFADGAFDLVFHSDTLEHVAQPLRALEECRRILKPGRRLCFTAPIVVGRLSRSRAGLPKSYHGDPAACQEDFIVHSEFGADLWTLLMRAGFPNVMLSEIEYPSGLALSAWTESQVMSSSGSASAASADRSIYDQDGLRSIHNHEFMGDPAFKAAYQRGVQAAGTDYRWHWRVHVGLWAASVAAKLPGDFVEFGVNRGFMSSAIMTMLGWNEIGRTFYLLDTFAGLDEHYLSAEDLANGAIAHNEQALASGFYTRNLDAVRRNFSEWPNARIIVGPVPDTLSQLHAEQIAFVHIDMNCALPEVAAVEFIWDRLVAGALVLLDDYAYHGYRPQKVAMDTFADSKGMRILSLPTGQGLLIKADAS